MKSRHVAGYRLDVIETLRWCGIPEGADFHALRHEQVGKLLEAADRAKYRAPKNANGSRARYFHDLLQRRAQRKN